MLITDENRTYSATLGVFRSVMSLILVSNTPGLTNTYWAIWMPVLISSANLIIMKNFFQQLPPPLRNPPASTAATRFSPSCTS